MAEYIGLDVSMKETAVSIRSEGKRIWRGKCASDPKLIAELIRKRAPSAERIVFETGPLSVWFWHVLNAEGLPGICVDARHAAKALDMAPNKTDANDADGLAQLAEIGYFKQVRVKGFDSMLTRTLVAARIRLVRITVELSNQIRGLMKTFGLVVPAGQGSTFEKNVRNLLVGQDELAKIILSMLGAWQGVRQRAAELGRQLMASARNSQACQILMSIPGIGTVTATSFMAAIEDPDNFRKSRSVGAWLGLTCLTLPSIVQTQDQNALRHSALTLPLKDSVKALSVGFDLPPAEWPRSQDDRCGSFPACRNTGTPRSREVAAPNPRLSGAACRAGRQAPRGRRGE